MEPNLDFWFCDREPDLHILRVENVDWATCINEMSSIQTFTDLQVYVNNNPLPEFVCEPKYTMSAAEMENLDLVALHHVPNDAPRNVSPIQIEGDGNCFPRSISYILYKSQNHYMEVRTRIIYEAVKNCDKYLDDFYVSRGAVNFYDRGTLPQQYGQYSENYNPYVEFNLKGLYEQEVLDICKDSTFCGIWQIFQVCNVIHCPIQSIHPRIGNPNIREDLNRTMYCIDNDYNTRESVKVMWTPMQVKKMRPCHFVPLFQPVMI